MLGKCWGIYKDNELTNQPTQLDPSRCEARTTLIDRKMAIDANMVECLQQVVGLLSRADMPPHSPGGAS